MDVPIQLLLLLCACACAHPLSSRTGAYGGYASEHTTNYEPYIYAAIPLHGPVPVLQVLSRRPLSPDRTHVPTVHHPVYAGPSHKDVYASSAQMAYEYPGHRSHGYGEPQNYGDSYQYNAPSASSQDEVTILYARPNPHGGFSYRRIPAKTAPKKLPAQTKESPVIIRVHRYRLVRDS